MIVARIVALVLVVVTTQVTGAIPRDALKYRNDLIRSARAVWGMAAPIAALAGQVHQESGWRPDARSAYASGLAQFTPSTADWISKLYTDELGANQPLNPGWALRAQARYMLFLHGRATPANTPCDRYAFALSSYNGGQGWVNKRQRLSILPGDYATTSRINPGILPSNQRENEHYPRAILLRWQAVYAAWGPGVDCRGVLA